MESLALVAAIVLFSALLGGPVAYLLTFLPSKPRKLRIARIIAVVLLSLIGLLFGFQLVIASGVPLIPRLIGFIGVSSSIFALLYEFKVLKHKNYVESNSENSKHPGNTEKTESTSDKKIYAVIFKSQRQDANGDLYYEHNDKLDEKIRSLAGYIKHSGMRHPENREGVTIAYFDSLDAINEWRKDEEHIDAKKLAKSHFYENYSVEITEVIDSYGWDGKAN